MNATPSQIDVSTLREGETKAAGAIELPVKVTSIRNMFDIHDARGHYIALSMFGNHAIAVRNALNLQPDLIAALKKAEAALADIGDADREEGDDVAWCEARAEALPDVRAAIAKAGSLTMRPITDTPGTTRAPISEALGFANAAVAAAVFWLAVAGGAWAVFG